MTIYRRLTRLAGGAALLGAALLSLSALSGGHALAQSDAAAPAVHSQREMVAQLSEHFASVPTMAGEFVQFGPDGEQTGGTFYIERPGKIRFNYEKPAAVEVISNGRTVAVHNRKLKTWDFYPLDKTPLKLLLASKIDVDDGTIRDVVTEADLTTVVMGNDSIFGDSVITLMFDPLSFDLRQWTIKDAKGKETSVMVFNVQKNVELKNAMFQFDERAIRRQLQERSSNR